MCELNDDLRAFLAERRYATLATHDPLFERDRLYFESFSGSRKIKNLAQNPSASVVVDARSPGHERWVSAAGTTEIVSGGEAQARAWTASELDEQSFGGILGAQPERWFLPVDV